MQGASIVAARARRAVDTARVVVPFVDLHIRALLLAQECAALGARGRTIEVVTGLPARQVSRLFCSSVDAGRRGRPPDSADWYFRATVGKRVQACLFASAFKRLRVQGFAPAEAHVAAFKHFRGLSAMASDFEFDRAFDLASQLEARWGTPEQLLDLLQCKE